MRLAALALAAALLRGHLAEVNPTDPADPERNTTSGQPVADSGQPVVDEWPPAPEPPEPPPARPPPASLAAVGASMLRRKGEPMLWFHVHKAGGTWMCKLAQLVGERVVAPSDNNCNWYEADRYKQTGLRAWPHSCADREEHFRLQGATWGQVEREPQPGDLGCKGFRYGTMLRDPMHLMESMLNFGKGGKRFFPWLRTRVQKHLDKPGDVTLGQDEMWKFFDNYQVRLFTGAWDVPAGFVTEDHFQRAKHVLAQLGTVLVLEDLNVLGSRLAGRLEWPEHTVQSQLVRKRNARGSRQLSFNNDERRFLDDLNRWDRKLVALYRDEPRV